MQVEAVPLDSVDRELLNRIQWDFPMMERPFAALGETIGIPEAEVIQRLARLKEERIIRQISAIFDTRAMGYRSSLVAMRFPPESVDEAALIINGHPGVSHNYKREHAFNLWFTVAVEPHSSLEAHVDALDALTGAEETLLLPTLKLFKIGVRLDMGEGIPDGRDSLDDIYSEEDRARGASFELTPLDISIVMELQEDLPLVPQPYEGAADRLGLSVEELFARCRILEEQGKLRRTAAILHHRRAGYRANGMGVWAVPPERVEAVGPIMASFKNVSHCYLRPTYRSWPYNLFSMIHARNKAECEDIAGQMSIETGITKYDVLYSTVEYKKIRLRLFTPEFGEWERHYVKTPQVNDPMPQTSGGLQT